MTQGKTTFLGASPGTSTESPPHAVILKNRGSRFYMRWSELQGKLHMKSDLTSFTSYSRIYLQWLSFTLEIIHFILVYMRALPKMFLHLFDW
jgi:hypothetical protein